jgi:hypothetical protein
MSDDIKYMDLKEFVEDGYLQEANRLFFHPLGLALSVSVDDDTGETTLHEIWDYREDPEGMMFGGPDHYGLDSDKSKIVSDERARHVDARLKLFGQMIQPLEPRGT